MAKCTFARLITLLALSSLILAGQPTTSVADTMVYVADAANDFGQLDLNTGSYTAIGSLSGLASGENLYGMGFGPANHLYGFSSGSTATLYQINTTTGALTSEGTISQSVRDATTASNGTFYAISQDSNATSFSLTPPSTSVSNSHSTGIQSTGMMAVTSDGSTAYTTAVDNSGNDVLYSINTATGQATMVGSLGSTNKIEISNGLFVNGTLYGFDQTYNMIVTINTSNATWSEVATYSTPNASTIVGSAASAVPEPSTVTMGLMALLTGGSIGLLRRKRSNRSAD